MKKQYVVGFPFLVQSPEEHVRDRDYVYLMEKKRPSWQYGLINGIGGKIEKDETPLDAMIREANEEAYGLEKSEWLHIITIASQKAVVYYYRTDVLPKNKVASKQDEPIKLFKVEKLPENIIEDLKWILRFAKYRHCYNPEETFMFTNPYM